MKRKADSAYRKAALVVAVAGVAFASIAADTVPANERIEWLSSVTEGYYNDPANWTGGVMPTNGIDGKYGLISFQANDMTIKAPAGGLVENSGTMFLGCGSGTHTLTIDTRGTFWEKRGLKAINNWWGTPFCQNLAGTHIFNFEVLDSSANNNLVWRYDDALFTWKSQGGTKQDYDLWSGKFSFGKALYLGSNGGTVNFYIHPEATLYSTGVFYQRGNATTHTWFLGGSNSLASVILKDNNANSGTTWMHVTNDAIVVVRGDTHLGNQSTVQGGALSRGVLDVSSSARLVTQGVLCLGSGNDVANRRNRGDITIRDSASLAANSVYVGYRQCSTGVLVVADSAALTTAGNCSIGVASNAWGRLEIGGVSSATIGGILGVANGGAGGSYGELVVKDDATLAIHPSGNSWLNLGSHSHAGSVARFTAEGRSRVTAGTGSVEMGYGFNADVELNVKDDAVVTFPAGYITNKVPVGGRSVVAISSNGVLAVRGVRGGVPGTDDACMQFAADGGTLKVSGNSMPPAPFICGCASATIGEHGLTFDSSGFDVAFDQAFTAADGAEGATLTKVGVGALTALRNSSHPKTKMTQGTLVFGPGVTRFGDMLDFVSGAKLELKDSTACIEADSLVFGGSLQIIVPNDYALDAAHPIISVSGGMSQADFANIVVSNPESGKSYEFSLSDEGKTVNLTVTAAAGGDKVWTGGASGSWNAAAGWTPAGAPTHNDAALVGDAAEISLSAPGEVASVAVTAAVNVAVGGASPLYVASAIDVTNGASLAVSVPVRNAGGTVEKGGTGTLTLSGDSLDTFSGNWRLSRGVTEFSSAAAIGSDSTAAAALAVSNCTFRYSGEAAEIERPWQLTSDLPTIFDIAGDLTFKNFKISHTPPDGGIVKLGAGTLTLDMPSGATTISWQKNAPRKTNVDVSGTFTQVNGETVDWNGLGQLTVLEGRLAIVGKGKTVTTVKQEHHGGIGGSGYVASAAPELYLKDLSINMGSGNGYHTLMGQQLAAGSAAPKLVLDNANATFNGLNIGHSKASGNSDVVHPVLAVTNGKLNVTWQFQIPNAVGGIEPIVRVGAGGILALDTSTASGSFSFYNKVDARIEDGGQIYVSGPQNLYFGGSASGELVFARGGGMKVCRFLALNSSNKAEIVLDGGYAQFLKNGGISSADYPAKSGIRAEAGGGELIVASGVSHALAIPLRGGRFAKTGAGTLVITNDVRVASQSSGVPTYTPVAAATVMVANTGGVEVAQGTLRCVAGTTDSNSRFSGVGTLSGEFTEFFLDVAPGATDALTFSNLTATKVTVDFGRKDTDTFNWRDAPTAVVAKIATQAEFDAIQWRSVNRGAGMTVDIRYDSAAGAAVATFRPSGGIIIFK